MQVPEFSDSEEVDDREQHEWYTKAEDRKQPVLQGYLSVGVVGTDRSALQHPPAHAHARRI